MNKLDIRAFALACGILWAAAILLTGLTSMFLDFGKEFFDLIASIYPGTELSGIGILIGTAWAFIDGFIPGAIFAWLYNAFAK